MTVESSESKVWRCKVKGCITQIGTDGTDPDVVDAVHDQQIADHKASHTAAVDLAKS